MKQKEDENTPICKLCKTIGDPCSFAIKLNSPLFDPLIPIPEKEKGGEEEGKELDHIADYYAPSPMYIASNEEDAPTLVNNLMPEATPEEKNRQKLRSKLPSPQLRFPCPIKRLNTRAYPRKKEDKHGRQACSRQAIGRLKRRCQLRRR